MNGDAATTPCDHVGCITCSDAAVPVKVLSVEGDDALCEDAAGNRTEVATELVAPVAAGDTLLVHGGVAIARVDREKTGVTPARQQSDRRERPSGT